MVKEKYIKAGLKTITAIARNKISGRKTPLLAYILITNRCNLDCVYCFSNAYKTRNIDIPLDKLYPVIDQLKENGTILITITGGEPCLRNDLGEIIDYISRRGMLVELVTNGINFEKKIKEIKKVDFLAISIDGNEEDHDKNRGKGSYRMAVKALEMALKHGIHTRIHASFSRNNAHSLPDLMAITQKYKVRANIAIPSIHSANAVLAFDDDEIREYYSQMKEYKKKGYRISNATSTLDYISKWPGNFGYIAVKPDLSLPFIPCKRKEFCIYIDADGRAYPCGAVWGKHDFNVFELGVWGAFQKFDSIPCTTCIGETEFNLLFQGNLSSILNVAAFGLWEKIKGFCQ